MKTSEKKKNGSSIDEKLLILRGSLKKMEKIMVMLGPLLEKAMKLPEAREYIVDGTFQKCAELFGDIADDCYEIGEYTVNPELLRGLKN